MSLARERPRSRNNALIFGGILLALLAGFGIWAYMNTRPAATVAEKRDIIAYLPLDGEVAVPPGDRADVYSPYRAPVAKVMATVGQKVARGEVLLELDFTNVQSAYDQARASVKAAEQAYAQAKSSYSAAVMAAQQRLSAARTAEQAARQPAPAAVQISPDGTTVTTPAAPQPTGDLAAATQERIAAEAEVAQAQAGLQAALIPYQQQLDAAREAFQTAQSGRKMASIRAPISGEVMAINAQPGAEVGKDRKDPVATIVDLSALQVQATMDKDQAGRVKPEMPVVITFEQVANQQFEGKVTSVVGLPEKLLSGPRYAAVIDFKNSQGLAKLGMKGRASVKIGEVKDVLAVPADAVDKDGEGRAVVEIQRGGEWVRTMVETGLSDGRFTEIKSGLKEGDVVKVTPDLVR